MNNQSKMKMKLHNNEMYSAITVINLDIWQKIAEVVEITDQITPITISITSNVSDVTTMDTWQEIVEVDQIIKIKIITEITTLITTLAEITTPTEIITSTIVEMVDKIIEITGRILQTEETSTI